VDEILGFADGVIIGSYLMDMIMSSSKPTEDASKMIGELIS
jgi:tryptophan synthase alpha subunit